MVKAETRNTKKGMNNLTECNFSDSPLMNRLHKRWVEEDFYVSPGEVYEKRNDLTHHFKEDIRWRMLNGKNYVIDLYSFTGRGKSTVAQAIGYFTHKFILSKYCKRLVEKIVENPEYGRKPTFDASNICFDTSELLKRLKEAVPMETFIYDEARSEKTTGSGSMREKWDKQRILKRVRVLHHNFILCDPIVDKSTIGNLCLYKIKPVGVDYKKKLNRSLLFAIDEGSDDYEMVGHIITNQYEVKGYLEKKLKFARDVETLEFGGSREALYIKIAEKILKEGVTKDKIPITEFKFQEWPSLLELETNFQYAKDELKIINTILRGKTARRKEKKEVKNKNENVVS